VETTLKVSGMTCKNCEKAVKDALLDLAGVNDVSVNLDDGSVNIKHEQAVEIGTLKETIEDQGYDVA